MNKNNESLCKKSEMNEICRNVNKMKFPLKFEKKKIITF